jgi:TrmH family RNA methyltransferase
MSRTQRERRPGKVLAISSHANPRIKSVRALLQPKHRREAGLFIAEGLKLVTDALSRGWRLETFIHQADAIDRPAVAKTAAAARAQGADILKVSADILAKISRRDNPQTVIGVVEQQLTAIDDVEPAERSVWIALERIKDPGNLGTIIRTADAVGADGVILVGPSVDPFSIEAVRATMGSLFNVPVSRADEAEFLGLRRRWPGRVIGTHLTGTVDFRAGDYRQPVLLVMGNEQTGLSDRLAQACDQLVRIPMAGKADSLNLAVATAVMLYEIRRDQLSL